MILGITGQKRSGKNTVAAFLAMQYGVGLIAFADPIKAALKSIFLWDDDFIEFHKEEVDPLWGISPRQAMQNLGNEWGQRTLSSTFPRFNEVTYRSLWVNNCFERMKRDYYQGSWIITDVRYPQEVEAVRSAGGKIVKVIRSSNECTDTHESEGYIESIQADYEIHNDGTLDDLKEKTLTLLGGLLNE